MTLFLASVTDAGEAEIAVAAGADIIDLKCPARGALGAPDPADVRAAVAAVAGRRPVSAVTGDLPMMAETLATAATIMADTGVDYVKVGLFPGPEREACIRAMASLAGRTRLIGVMFADDGPDLGLIRLMAACGFTGTMLDTARKDGKRLLDHLAVSDLAAFVEGCRSAKLMVGLAGSLEAPDIPRLLPLRPDVLGFRGALCRSRDRRAAIDRRAIEAVRALIPPEPRGDDVARPSPATLDHQRLATRGDRRDRAGQVDTVFLHDFTLPVRIGAYVHEREKPQAVRFNVDVEVARSALVPEGIGDVFSYDLIADGIRRIVAEGHVDFVEALAGRIAAELLRHPQVARVTVRVEKIEVGAGAVGVEIVRERGLETAKAEDLFPGAATLRARR